MLRKTPPQTVKQATCFGLIFGIALLLCSELKAWPDIFNESNGLDAERIDPDSHAENLIRWVEVDDSSDTYTDYNIYLRTKVFDEEGVEQLKQITLEGAVDGRFARVKARVTYPDGQVEELEKDTIVQNERFRQGRYRSKTVSFSPPKLEPGCVIDYTWRYRTDGSAYGDRFFTRANRPTHTFVFRMRFHKRLSAGWTWYGFDGEPFEDERRGYQEIVLKNQPASPDEDFQPSPTTIQPWISVFYNRTFGNDWVEEFWDQFAARLDKKLREDGRSKHKAIIAKAEELIAGEPDKLKQLQKIYIFCQQSIINIYDPNHGYTSEERESMEKKFKNAVDVLSEGYGNYYYINMLFAGLAEAAGFEVRLARLSDRNQSAFSTNMVFYGSLPDHAIAVKATPESDWIFCSPGNRFLPFGLLHFTNEPATALMSHPKKAEFEVTPQSKSNSNWTKRMADFSVDENGTLTGTVTFVYQGHLAVIERANFEDTSDETRIEKIRDELSEQFSNFTVENVEVSNLRDTSRALLIKFDLTVEGYSDFTSTRLFLNPSFFQKGHSRFFGKLEREFNIEFPFLQTVRDQIQIKLPKDYVLEQPGFPNGAANETYLKHQIVVDYDRENHAVIYKRNYELNEPVFPVEVYSGVRELYEVIYDQDNQLLTLKKEDADAVPVAAPETPPET